jgi:ribonuclease HII
MFRRSISRCYSIACASIVAKITRDRVMHALGVRHPEYRWEENVGYATALHLKGIAAHGITRHHRRSFLPVSQLSFDLTSPQPEIDAAQLAALVNEATQDLA